MGGGQNSEKKCMKLAYFWPESFRIWHFNVSERYSTQYGIYSETTGI
jgi:hypothetical protein